MADNLDDLQDDIHGQTALAGVDGFVGKLQVEELGKYPRVVWVSEGGAVTPPDDIGGRNQTTTRVRQVRTDAMAVQLHIWGRDREATRDVMHALIAQLWLRAYGSVEFGDYTWVTQEDPRAEYAGHGQKIILNVTIRIPVNEDANALTSVVTQTSTTEFESDLTGTPEVICS